MGGCWQHGGVRTETSVEQGVPHAIKVYGSGFGSLTHLSGRAGTRRRQGHFLRTSLPLSHPPSLSSKKKERSSPMPLLPPQGTSCTYKLAESRTDLGRKCLHSPLCVGGRAATATWYNSGKSLTRKILHLEGSWRDREELPWSLHRWGARGTPRVSSRSRQPSHRSWPSLIRVKGLDLGFRVWGLGFGVWGLGVGGWGLGCGVQGSRFGV